jgi:hypothetical protein
MILNLALAGGLGLLPGIGSVLLTSFRPNVRNAALLEEYLRMRSRNKPKVAAAQSEALAEKKTDPDDKSHIADEKKTSTDETKAAPKDEGRVELSDEGLAIGGVAGAAAATALLADAGIPTLNADDNQDAKARTSADAGTAPTGGGTGTPGAGAGGNGQAPDASAGALAPSRQDGNNDTNNQGASASVVVPGSNNNNSGGQGGSSSGSGFTPDVGEEAILEITAPETLRSGEHVMEEASNVTNVAMGDTSGQAVGSARLRVAALSAPESLQRHSRFIEDITDTPDIQDVVGMPKDMPGDWEEDEADIP